MSKVVEVSSVEEIENHIDSGKTVVVDFAAESWCVPCQRLKPHYEAAAEKAPDVVWLHADIEENPEFSERYNIRSVPTLLAYKGGQFVGPLPPTARTVITLLREVEAL